MIFKGNTREKQQDEPTGGNLSTLSKQSFNDIKRVIKPLYQNRNGGGDNELGTGKVSRKGSSRTSKEFISSSKNEYKQSSPSTHQIQGQESSRNSREYSRIES